MTKLFLVPEPSDLANDNVRTSRDDGVPYDHVSELLDSAGKKALSGHIAGLALGIQGPANQTWKQVEPGDWLLYYRLRPSGEKEAAFLAAAKVLHKQSSSQLGKRIWPLKPEEDPWSLVFFLADPIPVFIPVRLIAERSGFSPTMVIRHLTPVTSQGLSELEKKHNTIDSFIQKAAGVAKKLGKDAAHRRVSVATPKKRTSQKKGSEFEKKTAKFLGDLGFQIIGVGGSSKIGPYQIDVQAHYKDTLLVIECKSRGASDASLRNEILNFAGKQKVIEEAIRAAYPNQFRRIRFILAAEGVDVADADLDLADQNDVAIWTDEVLLEGEKLYRAIGVRTRYYILKELGITNIRIEESEQSAAYSVPALRTKMDGTDVYVFLLPAKVLLNLAYVYRLKPGNTEAYQRMLKINRLSKIADFINEGGGFKNNLICSFDSKVSYTERPSGVLGGIEQGISFGILDIPNIYGSMWVIDGQHRLFSYAKVSSDRQNDLVPVSAYRSDIAQQAMDFVSINQTQTTVSPDLLWSLLATTGQDQRALISRTIKHLNAKSVFKKQIYVPEQSRKGSRSEYQLYLGNLCKSLLDHGILDSKQPHALQNQIGAKPLDELADSSADVVNQYFDLVRDLMSKRTKWFHEFVMSNNGFSVFIQLLRETLKFTGNKWNKAKAREALSDGLERFFEKPPASIDDLKKFTSSESTRSYIAALIAQKVQKKHSEFGKGIVSKVDSVTLPDTFRQMAATSSETEEKSLDDLLKEEESLTLEFKVSLRHSYDQQVPKEVLEKEVVGGVAALANSVGGVMLVGVRDEDKNVVGLERDFGTFQEKKQNRDAFENHLINLLSTQLGGENLGLFKVSFPKSKGKEVCRIDVSSAPKGSSGVWYQAKKNQDPEFYVRAGNSSRRLNAKEAVSYIGSHFQPA